MPAFTLRLEPKLSKKLTDYCKKNGYKKNTLINKMVADFFTPPKRLPSSKAIPLSTLAKMAGLISLGGNSVEDSEDYYS